MIKSTEFKNALKSILMTCFIASLCGLSGLIFGKSFLAIFCIAIVIQIMLGYALSTLTFYNYKKSVYLAELEKIEKLSTLLNCAYCNETCLVTFLPEVAPELKCAKCNNTSSVKLHFTVARQTNIVTALSEPQKNHNIKL